MAVLILLSTPAWTWLISAYLLFTTKGSPHQGLRNTTSVLKDIRVSLR